MARLFLFNPSHEMALASDTSHYTPPKHIQRMEADLSMLPSLWADESDLILTPGGVCDCNGRRVHLDLSVDRQGQSVVPMPWGWNKSVRNQFLRLGVDESRMPSVGELDMWRTFSSRRWSASYNARLYEQTGCTSWFVDNCMAFCEDGDALSSWLSVYPGTPFILKSEYSSSGRGNRVVSGNCPQSSPGVPQPPISVRNMVVDRFYNNKVLDFAMEFEVTAESVRYLGLSVFKTTSEGKYLYNYVASQQELSMVVQSYMTPCAAGVLDELAHVHADLLSTSLLGNYRGVVGIDMMVVEDGRIHPCVEINLRMNMGVVAMMLYEKGLTGVTQPFFSHTQFCPLVENGTFRIAVRR